MYICVCMYLHLPMPRGLEMYMYSNRTPVAWEYCFELLRFLRFGCESECQSAL